ncbi:MAG: DegT/DnrJ/EryC1/StrS aminotransferase family protein [Gammaproteobacteria bacterium]|nr:DegT/DnrJ/EryC1/StrS aminotransferase family protein [Gammaproteobacteria bacterium]
MSAEFLPFARPLIGAETRRAVDEVLSSGWITSGPQVEAFESELSAYLGGRPLLSYSHATGLIEEALRALEIGPGDEVIVPDMTFAAGVNVVLRVGATPVPVDVDLRSRNLDAATVERAITRRTRAVMPVHFAGLPVALDPLHELCKARGLRVIEDAAHAIGSRYRGRLIGSFGDVACFSFHANKNLTTIEGGAVATADEALLEALRLRRFHGQEKLAGGSYDIVLPANKFNLTDVAARIGRDQLASLDERNSRRRQLAWGYFEAFGDPEHIVLPARGDEGHAWHMFAVCIDFEHFGTDRKTFREAMHERGIGVGVHYPPLHLLTVCREFNLLDGDFPNATRIGNETVTLPLFPEMRDTDVERVAAALREVLHA